MPDRSYSFGAAAKILDIPETKLRYWAQIGFVGPSVREAGKVLFSFQDLISVKAAKELVDRGFAVARIRKALDSVRASLPHVDRPLDRIRVAFDGDTLVVIDGGAAYEPTGQKVFDFGVADLAARAASSPAVASASGATTSQREASKAVTKAASDAAVGDVGAHARPATAYDWFTEAMRLDADHSRLDEAELCYRKALALDGGLAAAHTNLGRIAHRRGDARGARTALEAALALDPD
jgi:DNA-binding transcriptional MerR regulator